jgi:hypothetical protein
MWVSWFPLARRQEMQAEIKTPPTQLRAIAREDSHGTPYARTKPEVREEATALAEQFELRRGSVIVSTWLQAHGDSYTLHFDSREDGKRVVVHRWHSTGDVEVRLIFGSFWRPRPGREGVEYAMTMTHADDQHAGLVAAIASVLAEESATSREP